MYEFEHPRPVTVVLGAMSGVVEVTGEERDTVQVDVQPAAGGEAAQRAAGDTAVTLDGDTLRVQAPGAEHWQWRRTPPLRITVRVPAGSTLTGQSVSADIRVTGVLDAVRLDVASATVELAEATGNVDLAAASGDLAVRRVGGSLRIKSLSGDLRIGDVAGDVNAETASGDIGIRSAGGSLRAASASGRVAVGVLRQGQAALRTASGDVELGVAAGTGVWLDLESLSGRSASDLTMRGPTPPDAGSATLEVRVRTLSGDIRVYRAGGRPQAAA